MMILLTGGAANGRSAAAEKIAMRFEGSKVYIATMKPTCSEAYEKIDKHRKMREEKSFDTIECYRNIDNLNLENYSTILLECLSNLTANELFDSGDVSSIFRLIDNVNKGDKNIIIVTSDVFSDTLNYGGMSLKYISELAKINNYLAEKSDIVIEVTVGINCIIKGKEIYEKLV